MSELPRNFRDAIALTRTLAIEYLWIDSLCIIQDSAQDWQMECTWMTDIYAGSFINIGANASSNANGGIFCDRDPKTVMPLRASMNFKADDRLKGLYAILPISWKLGALEHAPLSKRSWTVQERLLSPRTIHSLSNKVIWDRPSLQASESDTTGLLEQTKGNFTMREWALSPLKEGNLSHRGNVCLRMWELAVKMYTRGELTFASDKLVAISGLARFLKDMWADNSITYLAGLWNYELEGSLTWHTSEGTPLVDDTYRAPSWSWAFVNGPITPGFGFPAGEGNKLPTKVLSVYTQPINDPFGPVNTGYMTLSSPLCRVQLQFSDDEPASKKYPLTLISTGHTLNFDYLYFDNRGIEGDNCRIVANSDYALAGIAKLSTTANLMEGLILHAIGSKAGQYIRIGFFEIESWGVVPEPNYDFVCPQCEYEKEVGEEDGFEDDHERIENAFKTMDLPPRMYEDKNMDDFTYRYEII